MTKVTTPAKVKKRDGSFVKFDETKIRNAILKAAFEVLGRKENARTVARRATEVVVEKLSQQYKGKIPDIENIQDTVEHVLMCEGYSHIAKSYILYRENRSQLRFTKSALGLKDDLKLPVNTMEVLRRRYLLKDESQNIIETPSELFRRVANHVAKAEDNFKSSLSRQDVEERFYQMMRNLEFMPNSPTLMNAGTSFGQLSACFVIPVEDSIEGIFEALGNMAEIHQSGGGTGFSFSKLRPKSDIVQSTSWPTALIIGMRDAKIALATISSLKGQRSSKLPPPLPTIKTSTRFSLTAYLLNSLNSSMARAISLSAPEP